jgi:hypothetical protein
MRATLQENGAAASYCEYELTCRGHKRRMSPDRASCSERREIVSLAIPSIRIDLIGCSVEQTEPRYGRHSDVFEATYS